MHHVGFYYKNKMCLLEVGWGMNWTDMAQWGTSGGL